MAKLNKSDVLKLAKLARLNLTNEEVDRYKEELASILDYVDQLQSLNFEDIPPTTQVTGLNNVMRKDEVINYGNTSDLLNNAPQVEKTYLKVRRMLE
ncbi:MAG: Asp-tRNA(Asn)/Glu-tRNA(Gln) amidotransferase subunit GatC [Candidatus Saccharimonadales bacterium]